MAMNVIEKGIPIPKAGTPDKYGWGEMQPGDSIAFAGDRKTQMRILAAARIYGTRKKMVFVSRRGPDSIRIWRKA